MDLAMIGMLALVVILAGVSKAAFAGSLGLLAMPLLSLVWPPQLALGVMLPILMLLDGFALRSYWQGWSWPLLRQLLPAAILGVLLASLLLQQLSVTMFQLLLGITSMLFALRYFLQQTLLKHKADGLHWLGSRSAGLLLGLVSGISSTLFHAGGPPLTMHLSARHLPSSCYIGTATLFFAVLNLLKVPAFVLNEQLSWQQLAWALPFTPLCFFAIQLGVWLKQHCPERYFLPLIHFLLLLTGLKLAAEALL